LIDDTGDLAWDGAVQLVIFAGESHPMACATGLRKKLGVLVVQSPASGEVSLE
jgi:hypothetical protein